ncbi:hypothetical protein ABFV80_001139 [Vandammella animalimorsus]|uniref:hypothetical protein n=1 Tax=Vandammella animalimorsus TaxID=2029117 RepID=UPI00325A8B04
MYCKNRYQRKQLRPNLRSQQGAQVHEAEGWVQHLNTQAVDSQLRNYQNQLKAHIQSHNGGNSTVGDVLGTRKPRIYALPYLAGTLPYVVRARAAPMSEVPARHKAQFQYAIYADQRSAAWGDSPLLQWQAPTAEIAGKKLTIAWVAATPADQQAIEALIPTPAPGQELDPSQLPQGLPSSIHLKPEIRLDGQTVAAGSAMRAGAEPVGVGGFTRYGSSSGQWDTSRDQLIAGQQTAIGLSIQGISQGQMQRLKERMEATKQKLEQALALPPNQRAAALQGITGEHLTGDMLTATVWGYFASLQSYGAIAGSQAQVIDLPALQYGLFHAQVQPRKPFGLVTTGISFKGLNMDIGHVRSIRWVKDDNPNSPINNKPELTQNGKTAAQNRWIVYNKTKGQYSSLMEGFILEESWSRINQCRYTDNSGSIQNPTSEPCPQGISTMKIISIAEHEGQKIYSIDSKNKPQALPNINNSEVLNAIHAEKEVIFHEKSINNSDWKGSGYSIVDPETGAGAYIIEGSGNGGALFLGLGNGVGFALFFAGATMGVAPAILFILGILVAVSIVAATLALISVGDPEDIDCYAAGFKAGTKSIAFLTAFARLLFIKIAPGMPFDKKKWLIAGLGTGLAYEILNEIESHRTVCN